MEYLVTARKWRPQTFKDIIGQDHLVQIIKNALSSGKIPHAFLFSGIRGVGKTTTARIIAKALNCQNPVNFEPCNVCSSCKEITAGYSMDVIEIDGASNRGIDNIREIKDTVSYMPLSGKYKIYIIDEVHMLTNEASNALLKTLEEPPEHVIFILATTEAHKVLSTIKSRCQHYNFKKITIKTIVEQLKKICVEEKIQYSEDALYIIANAADGSIRDAESIFDQTVLYSSSNITEEICAELIGIPDINYYNNLIEGLIKNDIIQILRITSDYINSVGDIKIFVKNFIYYLKNGMLTKKLGIDDELLDLSETKYEKVKELFSHFSIEEIIRIINIFVDLFKDLKGDASEKFLLDASLFKMADYRNMIPLGDLRQEILSMMSKTPEVILKTNVVVKPTITKTPENVNKKEIKNEIINVQPLIENNNDVILSEKDAVNAFNKVLSSSMIMKPMLSTIQKIEFNNNTLNIVISTAQAYEYLSKNKNEIIAGIQNNINKQIGLNFDFDNPVKKGIEDKGKDKKETIQEKPVALDNNQKKGLADEIINLFDGKIE